MNNRKNYCFLDLSGYMFSGKAAYSDLLREFSSINVPDVREEFDLIRIPDGINDLARSLSPWSPIASDIALRKFEKLCWKLSYEPRGIKRLWSLDYAFSNRFPNFRQESKAFVKNITAKEWDMPWPYTNHHFSKFEIAALKLKTKLLRGQPWKMVNYRLVDKKKFDLFVREYLYNLLTNGIEKDVDIIALHNAFEPFNPTYSMNFFDSSKSIIVDRDVRDIYMTGISYSKGFNDQLPIYTRISGSFDIDIFIERQKQLRKHVSLSDDSENVLRLNFEDLIYDYDRTVNCIKDFLNVSSRSHVDKLKYFDPKISKVNTYLWDDNDSNIKRIEEELSPYCTL